ncbi:PocR ligand-binding domain-containing protein [Klebsiella sp. S69]|uniref:PocR ligand-binding domain-containing protein n=1 Tax=Klebsiella sp. S69 TaxID=2767439 RepID=UPI0019040EE4|nr:PocR ligand-binding domain-containing protein [Klebsiella sp. S69]MBK0162399.1 PocR ligand-binding domain-containing protein [Klebsiella sp. S69]
MRNAHDILDNIVYDFANATGLGSVAVDLNGKEISPWYNFTSFCQQVRQIAAYHPYCQQCDRCGGFESTKAKQIQCYRCHAGLVDFSIPIFINGNLTGFVSCGQARVAENLPLPKIVENDKNLPTESKLIELYHEVPELSLMKIKSAAQLLNLIIENYLNLRIVKNVSPVKNQKLETLGRHQATMEMILNHINQNFSDNLNLEQMSAKANLSMFYFSRTFKELTGTGFTAYLTNKRMTEAHCLLEQTNWSIEKIARSVGYNDVHYFSRLFKKTFNRSASEFRNHSSGFSV